MGIQVTQSGNFSPNSQRIHKDLQLWQIIMLKQKFSFLCLISYGTKTLVIVFHSQNSMKDFIFIMNQIGESNWNRMFLNVCMEIILERISECNHEFQTALAFFREACARLVMLTQNVYHLAPTSLL